MTNRRKQLLKDKDWNEVRIINHHAVLMGYLSMAIKGLGYLVLTWTTVVLLGGFVSMLHKKDFWCLTFITLVQTAGIFDVVMNEKLRYMRKAVIELLSIIFLGVMGNSDSFLASVARYLLACVLILVQLVVLAVVLCPLAAIYVCGILMSGGISLWRLIEHDYAIGGNSNLDSSGGSANLVLAMDTLYYLALLQGVLFCYRFILHRTKKRLLSKEVATKDNPLGLKVVSKYLRETRNGCEKDPSFAKGRNLITHAVDMIGSRSPIDCISGVNILYNAICIVEKELEEYPKWCPRYHMQRDIVIGQRMLMKHLVMSASSSTQILEKLLETLDSRGLHDRETRNQAAMIVERLASNINLEKFPRGIQHISSLIGTFEQYSIAEPYQQDCLYDEQHWDLNACCLTPLPAGNGDDARGKLGKEYKELLLQGFYILRKLAADENNCRVMSNTRDLVSKIMAPVTSDLLHSTTDDHGAWSDIVEKSMEVMSQLISALGETGAKLRHEISICEEAISTLHRILSCNVCKEGLQQRAIQILTRLYMDTESSRSTNFVRMLVYIFTRDYYKYGSSIKEYAGGALSKKCSRGGINDATVVIQTDGGDVVDSLTAVLVHDRNKICRKNAAEILEHLCTHYTEDDECLGKLKKAMTGAIPEVLGEILDCGDEAHKGKEVDNDGFAKQKTDIESQYDNGRSKEINSFSSSHSQKDKQGEEEKESARSAILLSSLLSLCGTVYDKFICELGPDLAPRFHASSFLNKLKVIVVNQSNQTIENLTLFKAIAMMVISVMKQSGGKFVKQDLESLIEALTSASKNMLNLDLSMVFSCDNSLFATTLPKLNRRTLASIVKEAKQLHAMAPSTSVSG